MKDAERFRDYMLRDLVPSTFDPHGSIAKVLKNFINESYDNFVQLNEEKIED